MKNVKLTLILSIFLSINLYAQLPMSKIIYLRTVNDKSTFYSYLRMQGDYSYVKDSYINGFEDDGLFATYAYCFTTEWGHPWAPIWIYKNFSSGDIFYKTSIDELNFFKNSLNRHITRIQPLPNGDGNIVHIKYENLAIGLFFINRSMDYYVYIT